MKDLLYDFERGLILDALQTTGGRQKDAALALGILPTTLCEKMKRLGLRERDSAALPRDIDGAGTGAPAAALVGPDLYRAARLARAELRPEMDILEAVQTVHRLGPRDTVNSIVMGDCAEHQGRRLNVAIQWQGSALSLVRMILEGTRVLEETVVRARRLRRVLPLTRRLIEHAECKTLSVHLGEWSFRVGIRNGVVQDVSPLRYQSRGGLAARARSEPVFLGRPVGSADPPRM
ncbi:MAG TPA: helix-turn-helix domain-containing protein [Vicinamibacteria bacterium]|nr:helix-turn-helix domain-containing protein [Vicinamibacteria bacterium]